MAITVHVKKPDGSIVDIQIEPTCSIYTLQTILWLGEKGSQALSVQKMTFNDLELKSDQTLQDAGIKDGDTICVGSVLAQTTENKKKHEERDDTIELAQSAQHPSRAGILIAGTAIGAGIAALASTAVSGALGYFAQGTAEQLGMAFGISIPVGALLGFLSIFTALKMRDRKVEMEKGIII